MNFDTENNNTIGFVEKIIKKYLPKEEGKQKIIFEAINYSILAGGKRLRPILLMETFKLFNGEDIKIIEPFMAAIEMIHTYSLVHDDLPAMDNDEYRRGKKTTHIVYGEDMAILAGDGILNLAFETALTSYDNIENMELQKQVELNKQISRSLQVMANKAGIYGMIGGQVGDVLLENEEIEKEFRLEQLNFIYRLKTAALIEASMMIGAILAGADEESIKTIEQLSRNIGLAFQIKDDVLDIISTQEVLGKPVNSDNKNKKITYTTEMTVEEANSEVESLSNEAILLYDGLTYENDYLRLLITKLISREF
ncbi:MAG TPA: polyprenyl synthetase family protein [Clostridiales bacterium]|nr:polyprenyl synthetase family protein [Clostridiales bacterium]